MSSNFERYRIAEGTTVKLADVSCDDKSAFDGSKQDGEVALAKVRKDIAKLQERLYAEGTQRLLVVLQAMDTAGKDSTIRDVFRETNPNGVDVAAFGRPSDEELAHDYLWRVHAHTPAKGKIQIFNRSHYEDVLVVRVNELVPKSQWKRRYRHIRDWEQMLVDEGVTICKFFLHISKDEQKERLQERLDVREKNWKFERGDLEVRLRWDDYMEAYGDAISETSTADAPWFVIPANDRWYRKLAIAEIVRETLSGLDPQFPPPEPGLDTIVID
jgi:PPK2 family polyphosphate:nucleotide phosphotransferase